MVEYDDGDVGSGDSPKEESRWSQLQENIRSLRNKLWGGSPELPDGEEDEDG